MGQRLAFFARRPKGAGEFIGENSANHRRTLIPGHVDTFRYMPKIIQIQAEPVTALSANDVPKLFDESRLSMRREAHHFSFVAIMRKAEELRRGGVEDSG